MSKVKRTLGSRAAFILGGWAVPLLVFIPLYRLMGPTTIALIGLPVIVTGWFFGMYAGLLASLLAFPLTAVLVTLAGEAGWDVVIRGLPGFSLLVLLGSVIGRLSDLDERAKQELTQRERVEDELRRHHDHLEELVGERTAELRRINEELQEEITERKRAEEETKAKSQFLESLIEQSPLPTFVIDSEGICVMVNEAFLKAYNVSQKELVLGMNALTEPANVRQGVVEYIQEALSGKVVETPEIEFVSPYENKRTVTRSRLFPIFDAAGELTNVVVMHEDITEHVRAEEAVRELERRESEEKYRVLFETAKDAIFLSDETGRFVDVNQAACESLGYSKEELLKLSNREIDANPRGYEGFLKARDGPVQEMMFEVNQRRKDGTLLPVEVTGSFFTIGGQRIALAIARDISERKRTEAALRESEDKFRTIFETVTDMITYVDKYGKILDVNKRVEDLLGYKRDEVIGKNFARLGVLGLRDLPRIVKLFRDTIREGEAVTIVELDLRHKNREKVSVEVGTRFIKKNGKVEGVVNIFRDITERKRAEEALRKAHDKLEMRVAERTAELARANEELQSEIIERRQAEEALRESEIKHRLLLHSIESPVLALKDDMTILYCNDAYAEFVGKSSPAGLQGENLLALFPVFKRTKSYSTYLRVLDTGERQDVEGTLGDRYLRSRVFPTPWGILALAEDITERKRVEEEIRQRTAQLEALRQMGLELTSHLDLDALLHSVVSRAVELLGGVSGSFYLYRPDLDALQPGVSIGIEPAPNNGILLRRGEGLSGKVLETGESLIVDNYQQWEGRATAWEGYTFAAVVAVPVCWGEEFLGVLNVDAEPPRTFSPADAELLNLFATQAATAIQNARLYEQAQREIAERKRAEEALKLYSEQLQEMVTERTAQLAYRADQLGHLRELGASLLGAASLEETLRLVTEGAVTRLRYEVAAVGMYHKQDRVFEIEASYPRDWRVEKLRALVRLPREGTLRFPLVRERTLVDQVLAGETLVTNSLSELLNPHLPVTVAKGIQKLFNIGCLHFVPLLVEGKVVGILIGAVRASRISSQQQESLLLLADQAALAIRQAQLRELEQQRSAELAAALSELHDAQEQLIRREKLAIIGQLAAGVAHELRNPLGAISNVAYLLKLTLLDADEATKESLETIIGQVRESDRIISDLLDFSRTRVPDRREVAVSELVAQALAQRPPPENVEVATEIAADLPPVYVDHHQMGQVFDNLITNACQAMKERGTLTISAQAEEGQVAISVADTGIGIPQENMAKLFEPLFTTRPRGLGLGLMVVENLVKANEGSIEVESKEGQGSTFTVCLPLAAV